MVARRVIQEFPLTEMVSRVWCGPRPTVLGVSCVLDAVWVAIEVDAPVPDLSHPVYHESSELRFDLFSVERGWHESVRVLPYHRHVGSVPVGEMWWHVYLVGPQAADLDLLRSMNAEAQRMLRRSEVGHDIRLAVQDRDRQCCRFCGVPVGFGPHSKHRYAYVVVDLWAPPVLDNVVLACEPCADLKGVLPVEVAGLELRPPDDSAAGDDAGGRVGAVA